MVDRFAMLPLGRVAPRNPRRATSFTAVVRESKLIHMGTFELPMEKLVIEVDYELYEHGNNVGLYLRVASEASAYFDCQRFFCLENFKNNGPEVPFDGEDARALVLWTLRRTPVGPIEQPLAPELFKALLTLGGVRDNVARAVSQWLYYHNQTTNSSINSDPELPALIEELAPFLRQLSEAILPHSIGHFLEVAQLHRHSLPEVIKFAQRFSLENSMMWSHSAWAITYMNNKKLAPLVEKLRSEVACQFLDNLSAVGAHGAQKRVASMIYLEQLFSGACAFPRVHELEMLYQAASPYLDEQALKKLVMHRKRLDECSSALTKVLQAIKITNNELALVSLKDGIEPTLSLLRDWEKLLSATSSLNHDLINIVSFRSIIAHRLIDSSLEPDWELQLLGEVLET